QNRMDEAAQSYKQSIASTKDPVLKSNAYFNLGNTYFQQKDYGESIKAYKEALKLQPKDEEAKKNLMLAMRQLQQQQQQQQQNQQQQQEQEKDKQDQQQQNQQQQQQQQQDQQQNKEAKENEKNEPVSKDEAREILKAIEREDQRVQEKLKKETGSNAKPVKDW
ncbi:MAG TPA: tetratricopeptide repeat protein, partial [Saprospiraceae bacterium]|nr:tetratricopeptide repeat protein [Saprospiraceae bacterium]